MTAPASLSLATTDDSRDTFAPTKAYEPAGSSQRIPDCRKGVRATCVVHLIFRGDIVLQHSEYDVSGKEDAGMPL